MDFAKPRRAAVQRDDDTGVQLHPMSQNPPNTEQAPETLQMVKTPSLLDTGMTQAAGAAHAEFPASVGWVCVWKHQPKLPGVGKKPLVTTLQGGEGGNCTPSYSLSNGRLLHHPQPRSRALLGRCSPHHRHAGEERNFCVNPIYHRVSHFPSSRQSRPSAQRCMKGLFNIFLEEGEKKKKTHPL